MIQPKMILLFLKIITLSHELLYTDKIKTWKCFQYKFYVLFVEFLSLWEIIIMVYICEMNSECR